MVIGIDGSRAFIKGRTGTENYSYQLLRNLSYIDTENQYLIYIKKSQVARVESLEWPDNFQFKVVNMPRLWTQAGLAFRTFIDPIDVLFVPSHTLPLLRRPGLKTVLTVHDLGAEYLPAFHQLKQVLYLKLMTHYQLKTATRLISVSKATKEDLIKRVRVDPGKIDVVYEGVDKMVFKKMPNDAVNDIVKKYDLVRGKYFLFVGTIQPRKNLERVIKAFAEFLKVENGTLKIGAEDRKSKIDTEINSQSSIIKKPSSIFNHLPSDAKLVLVGGKGWKSQSIYKLPYQLGIEDKVKFVGRIPDDDLVGLYNGACALTYPSLFEGFGLPIIEAYSCHCPVITSNVSSMPEIARDGAILVDPENEHEILKAMIQIYIDDTLRYSLINKGILCCKRFDWKITAKKTIEILERTAGKQNL